jgi:hypothetical protein
LTNNEKFNNLVYNPSKIGLVLNLSSNTPLAVLNEFRLFKLPIFCLSSGNIDSTLMDYSLLYNIESPTAVLFLTNYFLFLLKNKKKVKKKLFFFFKNPFHKQRRTFIQKYEQQIKNCRKYKKLNGLKKKLTKLHKKRLINKAWRQNRILKFFSKL